jgi:hypothetical protein
MHSYLVGQLARQRHHEIQAEQQMLRAVVRAKTSRQAQRPDRQVRWVVQKMFRLRSAQDS